MTDPNDPVRQSAALDYAAYTAEAAERVKYQIELVERGIQTLMFMNGGALVALYTVVGRDHAVIGTGRLLWTAFGCFAAGLVLTAGSNFAAFLSQIYFARVTQLQAWDAQRIMVGGEAKEDVLPSYKRGQITQYFGMAFVLLALLAFVVGCAAAVADAT